MRKHLLTAALLITTILLSSVIHSQSVDRFAYAITDIQKEGSGWNYLRKLDLRSGKFSDIILKGVYLIKLTSQNNRQVYTRKIVVQ